MDKRNFAEIFVLAMLIFIAGCKQKAPEPVATAILSPELNSGTATAVTQGQTAAALAPAQTQGTAPALKEQMQEPVAPFEFIPPSEREIQQALKDAGLYDGEIDGKIGHKTKKAIEEFQAKNNLKADGKVGPKTWEMLREHINLNSQSASPAKKPSS